MIIMKRIWYERIASKKEFHFDKWLCFLLILTKSEMPFRIHEKSYTVDKLSETEYCTDTYFVVFLN